MAALHPPVFGNVEQICKWLRLQTGLMERRAAMHCLYHELKAAYDIDTEPDAPHVNVTVALLYGWLGTLFGNDKAAELLPCNTHGNTT